MNRILDMLNLMMSSAGKTAEVRNEYRKLLTDQERVIYTLRVMLEYDIIPNVCGDIKSLKESEKFREEGNQMFLTEPLHNTNCVKVFKLYTKSIAYAPYPSVQLALAYGNRSAVLIKMHKYVECIRDIDRALSSDYPDELKAKVYVRKAECLVALKKSEVVEKTLNEAQYWLEKMSLSDTKKRLNQRLAATKRLSLCIPLGNDRKINQKCKNEIPLPKIESANPEVPYVSDAVAIKYNEQYGRHVVALRDIKPGEVLCVEKPYLLLLKPDNVQTHCSNCLEVSWANIPCKHCTYAMYCSEECRDRDWEKYHEIECAIFPSLIKLDFSKLDLCTLRMAIHAIKESNGIQNLKDKLQEIDKCDDPRTKGFSKDGILMYDKYQSMYALVTNTEKRSVADLFRRSVDASFILYFLATCTDMFGSRLNGDLSALATNDDVTFVGGLILRHQQMVPSNLHRFAEQYGLELVQRGLAALPFGSLINHCCNPNITWTSRSGHMIIHVIYPIKKGEQILDNYGEHYAITPKHARQAALLKQYYFMCDCLPCKEDWPLYFNLQSYRDLVECNEDKKIISRALRNLNKYISILMWDNVSDKPYILEDLLNMIQVLYDHVSMPCEEMNNVVETLKHVYDLSGNRFELPTI